MANVHVQTRAGVIEGRFDGSVASFLGIPYGASTAGGNRFRPPRPVEAWSGVRPALEWGPRSYQTPAANPLQTAFPETFAAIIGDDLLLDVPMSEDCLSLNVWTRSTTDDELRPVLVWIHGGGACGSPSEYRTDGAALAARGDVVVVSVTHRLNVFGYLCLRAVAGDEYQTSGGVGHLDLVLALEWVRENVASFGGDPEKVTIFGESAGGAKVACLMTMPQARGLFRSAVIQSGADTASGLSATVDEAELFTNALLEELNLKPSDWHQLLDLPPTELVRAHEVVAQQIDVPYVLPPPGPTVDGVVLERTPLEAAVDGGACDVPLLIGACRDETKLFLIREDYYAEDRRAGTLALEGPLDRTPLAATGRPALERWLGPDAREIIDAYTAASPDASFPEIDAAIRGDRQFLIPSFRFIDALLERGQAPVYVYSFAWVSDVLPELGAFHSMDIEFFFSTTERMSITSRDASSSDLAGRMTDALIAFARSGDPNHRDLPHWPRYELATRPTMVFDRRSQVTEDFRSAERQAWEDISAGDLGF